MSLLIETLVGNALAMAGIAVMVGAIAVVFRQPSVLHACWILVLMRLFLPALWTFHPPKEILPQATDPAALMRIESNMSAPRETARIDSGLSQESIPRTGFDARAIGLLVWLVGGGVVLLMQWRNERNLKMALAGSSSPSPELQTRVNMLAGEIGVAQSPVVSVHATRIAPAVWVTRRGLTLLIPKGLLDRLDAEEVDSVLYHELMHIRRRDHWVRYLELAATVVFWWHPLVWWVRNRLRDTEEESCDAAVLALYPGRRRAYAGALLKTLSFQSEGRTELSALACGVGDMDSLRKRLTQIMSNRALKVSRWGSIGVLGLVTAGMLALPGLSESQKPKPSPQDETELEQLRQQEAQLENELRSLRIKREELELHRQQQLLDSQLDLMRSEAARLRSEGEEAEADRVLAEMAFVRRQQELQLAQQQFQIQHERAAAEMELELNRATQQLEDAHVGGDPRAVEALQAELSQRRIEFEVQMVESQERRNEWESQKRAVEVERLRALSEVHRAQGELQHADRLLAEAEWLQQRGALDEAEAQAQRKLQEIEVKAHLEQLLARAGRLDEAGEHEEAEAIRREVRRIEERLAVKQRRQR